MARIGIDARKYFDYGIGTYIQELVKEFQQLQSSHSFLLFLAPEDMMRVQPQNGTTTVESRFGKYSVGEFFNYGAYIRRHEVDLFHEPHYTLPRGLQGRSVVTIHDLIHLKFPEYFNPVQRAYAAFMIRQAVTKAGALIVISRKTKEDIVARFGVREDRVHVIYNGVSERFRKIERSTALDDFRKSKGLDKPYVLYVGGLGRHKNIPVLLKAFRLVRASRSELDLVFAGERLFDNEELSTLARELDVVSAIKDCGRMDGEELVLLYNSASIVVLPSLYEGFGFPALEVMACGTPAIVSDRGSLPEVAGNGGLSFEANRPDSLAEALMKTLDDSQFRSQLVERGTMRAAQFTWRAAAKQTLAVYESLL